MRTVVIAILALSFLATPVHAQDGPADEEAPPIELSAWPVDGWRAGVAGWGAQPTGDLGEKYAGFGYGIDARLGYEYVWDSFGLAPQGGLAFGQFGGKGLHDAFNVFHLMPGLRAQLHLGAIAPWVAFHIGMSNVKDETGLGETIGGGIDLFERTSTRFGLFVNYELSQAERGQIKTQTWLNFGLGATFFL